MRGGVVSGRDGESQSKPGAREGPLAGVELLAQGGDGPRPVGRTQRREGDPQFVLRDVEIGGGHERGLDEGAAVIGGPAIVRRQAVHEIAFGLVGHHCDNDDPACPVFAGIQAQ